MKWTKKGHEFDAFEDVLRDKEAIYIYGAGKNGELIYKALQSHKWPRWTIYFVDRSAEKQQQGYFDCPVIAPEALMLIDRNSAFVVISMKVGGGDVAKKLEASGFDIGSTLFDYFSFTRYLATVSLNQYDRLFLHDLGITITTVCSLNCRNCSIGVMHRTHPRHSPLAVLQAQADRLFSNVDYVNHLSLLGGEVFLHPSLLEYLQYIISNYSQQFDGISLLTNGFCKISDALLNFMLVNNIHIALTDYRKHICESKIIKKIDCNIDRLTAEHVELSIQQHDYWVDMGFMCKEAFHKGEELQPFFNECNPYSCRGYANGNLVMCNPAYFNQEFLNIDDPELAIPIDIDISRKKHVLLEYYLGFTTQGYLQSCRYCRGMDNNPCHIEPGVQG